MVTQRKLATIMAVDVAGYSRAAEVDDGAAAEAVGALRQLIETVIAPYGGRVFNSAGDGFMIEFPAASSGAHAAMKLLSESAAKERQLPKIRIGLHLGEVIVGDSGDLLGHGVNVAARLQAMAEPGGALVSGAVQSQLREAANIPLVPRGRVQLDKMSERIDVFALTPGRRAGVWRDWRKFANPLVVALALVVIGVGGWLGWRALAPTSQRIAFFGFMAESADPLAAEISAAATDATFQALLALRLEAASRADTQGVELPRQRARAADLGAAYALGGEVRTVNGATSIQIHLEDVASRTTLWEQTVSGGADDAVSLPVLAAGAATRVARCMVGARASLPRQDGHLLAELATACATPFIAFRDAVPRWRALARRAPDSAVIQANFANSLLYHANHAGLDGAELSEVWKEATTAAQRALTIEPDNGVARTVLAYNAIFEGRPLSEAGKLMDQAVRDSPDDWRRGEAGSNRNEFLQGVGRNSESLAAARAVLDLDPLSPTPYSLLAQALLRLGRVPEAGRVLEQMSARWPDAWWETWAFYAFRYEISDMDVVLSAAPTRVSADTKTCWRKVATAYASNSPAVRRAGADTAAQCGADGRIDSFYSDVVRNWLLSDFQAILARYEQLLSRKRPSNFLWNAGVLLGKNERALRASPQFLPLMKKSGIYQYWLDTGTHPDVCDLPEERNFELCASLRADQTRK